MPLILMFMNLLILMDVSTHYVALKNINHDWKS